MNKFPWWLRVQRICLQYRKPGFNPWVRKIPGEGTEFTLVLLPGEFHGQSSLSSYSPWDLIELDTMR